MAVPGVTLLLRTRAWWERLMTSLWAMPAVAVTASIALGLVLDGVTVDPDGPFRSLVFGGSAEGARALLSTVAGSLITVTGLVFSLTVVALQVAASQFTPRLLRTFLADRGNQVVLSTFLATFVYALVVLRSVRSEIDDAPEFVPHLAITVGFGFTFLSVAMLVFFFHHLTQQLRVESVLAEVERDTLQVIRSRPALADATVPETAELPRPPADARRVRAARSGYLQTVDVDGLAAAARHHGLAVRIRPAVGTHVTRGATLAWVWGAPGTDAGRPDEDTASDLVHGSLQLGFERSMRQDIAFGLRQLVDIAARALSPGINDPTTAVNAIGSMAVVLEAAADRALGAAVRTDDTGAARAAVPWPTFGELVALAVAQPLRYGGDEPFVIAELLRMLTDVAEAAPPHRRQDLAPQLTALREAVAEVPTTSRGWLAVLLDDADHAIRTGARPSGPVAEGPAD
jgi:uncharacterized membrane protein